ncbi:MAG: SAM-dependent methyltransferase [Methylophaga sp.]|nr:MAG: SAM-dependent methyltransferase [Methylophaga sp.]
MKISSSKIDLSNGWESIADSFIENRNTDIGVSTVEEWSKSFKLDASILDIGCGFGVPHSQLLANTGFKVYGIDASQTLINEFQRRFPQVLAKCETVEESSFFNKKFDGIIAIGLMFILSEQTQLKVLTKVAEALNTNGRFLFTSPYQICEWVDILTGLKSQSLGKAAYVEALSRQGLSLVAEYSDEGENNYFDFIKL